MPVLFDYDPEQLKKFVERAESMYEKSRVGIVIYWHVEKSRFGWNWQSEFESSADRVEVIYIPFNQRWQRARNKNNAR